MESELPCLPPQAVAAADAIRRRWNRPPAAGLVLGTGLHGLCSLVSREAVIAYDEIPGFQKSTALGHAGQLICGRLNGTNVVAMDGRCHLYEGYEVADLLLPIYAMRALGIRLLVLSNASGGLNPAYASGDVVVIQGHLNLMFWNAMAAGRASLRSDRELALATGGWTDPISASGRLGRLTAQYDPALVERAVQIARRHDFVAHRGVYVGVTGPNYETRAEYRFLRKMGGDIVGMSTVPAAIAAAKCGLQTLALSAVTNVACPDRKHVVLAEDVVQAAQSAEPKLRTIVLEIVSD